MKIKFNNSQPTTAIFAYYETFKKNPLAMQKLYKVKKYYYIDTLWNMYCIRFYFKMDFSRKYSLLYADA